MNKIAPIGPYTCDIAIVGEFPGVSEEQLGVPFAGSSGELLTKMMHAVGIIRESCFITNVIKVRPPANNAAIFIDITPKGVKTTPDYDAFEQELYAELDKCTANVIITLGNIALYALTRKTSITKWRGSVLMYKDRKVLPTINPAAALREHLYTYQIMHDLARAKEESTTRVVTYPERHIKIRPSHQEAMAYLMSIQKGDRIGFDIEVINNEVSCFAVAKSATDVMSIPLYSRGDNYYDPEQELEIWDKMAAILYDEDIEKVGQNLAFDSTFMMRRFSIATKNMKDTMIAQAIVAPEMPKGLDFITSMYTKEVYYKDDGKKYMKIGGDDDSFWIYNAKDAAICVEALPEIEKSIDRINCRETYERQTKLLDPLLYMQNRGIRVDNEGLKKESIAAAEQIEKLIAELHTLTGYAMNPGSPKQIGEYFYGKVGMKPYKNRKTGNDSTDEDALKRIARKGYKEANLILDIRGLEKQKGTYYDMKMDDDGRLRCSFNPVGTKQGRLSSSKTIFGTGGNMQNLTKEFKKHMLADEGYVLYNLDLSQAENRVVAYTAPDHNMIKAFEEKIDIHSLTASLIFGGDLSTIKREDDEGIPCSLGGGGQTKRFWGKKANHGLNYDLGYKTFAFYYEIQESEAKFICQGYHRAYPGVGRYHDWIKAELGKSRTLTNCLGRTRKFYGRWGDELFKEAYSYIPQSTVADKINRDGLLYIYNDKTGLMKPVELLNQIHDAILFQLPISIGVEKHKEILRAITSSLEKPIEWHSFSFSIPCDIQIGLNAKEMMKVKNIDSLGEVMEKLLHADHSKENQKG